MWEKYCAFARWCGFSCVDNTSPSRLLGALLSCLLGFMAGVWGIGGGLFLFPLLVLFFGLPPDIAAGNASVLVFITASLGTIEHAAIRNVDLELVFPLVIGGCFGVVASETLRRRFRSYVTYGHELTAYGLLLVFAAVLLALEIA